MSLSIFSRTVLRALGAAFGLALLGADRALAAVGAAKPWQTEFQTPVTPVMENITGFNDMLFVIIVAIFFFVLALLLYTLWRFNAKRNPQPSKTTHNTLLEVIWTAVPIMILVVIAIPSFKLLYYMDRVEDADLTIKAIGHQWYWSYEYPDNGDFAFDALIVPDDEITDDQMRLLTTDNAVVLPVNTTIRLQTTADDVIHSWAMPAFGVKLDAVPGRLNETWIRIEREGVYYGQCSELCGVNHGYMPIMVKAVSKEAFAAWVEKAKQEFARNDAPATTTVARAEPETQR